MLCVFLCVKEWRVHACTCAFLCVKKGHVHARTCAFLCVKKGHVHACTCAYVCKGGACRCISLYAKEMRVGVYFCV